MFYKSTLHKIENIRNRYFFLLDIFIVLVSPAFTLFIRLDDHKLFSHYWEPLVSATLLLTITKLSIFYFLGLYRRYWQKASIDDLARLMLIGFFCFLLDFTILAVLGKLNISWLPLDTLPQLFAVDDTLFTMLLVTASRLSIRFSNRIGERINLVQHKKNGNTLIIGAGSAGIEIAEELQRHPKSGLMPVGFIDDNPEKLGFRIRGLEVKGNRSAIPEVVHRHNIKKILIAMPSERGTVIREILDICQKLNVETFTMPGLIEIAGGKVTVDHIKKIEIDDLLRREVIKTDTDAVTRYFEGKRIIISGAGGSIGSELCRQILKYSPSEIVLLGHGENSIFEIQNELKEILARQKYSSKVKIHCKIADLRFRDRLDFIFSVFNPDIVLHAAAHKHVPLMEENPLEAVTNNVLGTQNLVDISLKYNVKDFVLISSDKAVNPTSVMGATKRLAEIIVQNAALISGNPYCAVRFGNVLGSRGSVVRTFKRQIASGGPITVTDPEITRYFITIPEAVQLVLQAAVLSKGGEIFMLDMGKPVKVVDLAKDIIRLSGLEFGIDINIKFTGLRPGEKLYEELFLSGENYERTLHEKIFIAQSQSLAFTEHIEEINSIISAAQSNNYPVVLFKLKKIVPEYTPAELHDEKIRDFSFYAINDAAPHE